MGNKKTVLFKDQDHYNLTIEADENGYCITFSDGSKTYDKVNDTVSNNFETAFSYVLSCGYKLREIAND